MRHHKTLQYISRVQNLVSMFAISATDVPLEGQLKEHIQGYKAVQITKISTQLFNLSKSVKQSNILVQSPKKAKLCCLIS